MSTNLEYRERERHRKRESKGQASKAQREKERQTEREIKDKGDIFSVRKTTWKFCSGGGKIRNASAHQGENERQWKNEQEHARHFLHKTCNQEVSGSFTL